VDLHRWYDVIVVWLACVPLAALLVAWLAARRRRAGVTARWALRSAFAETLMVVGTIPWLWMTMTPDPGHSRGRNLIPFHDLRNQFHVGLEFAVTQITGNLLVFAALGFGLMIRFRIRPAAVLAIGAAGSALIETLQWVLDLGRFSSVDDVLVNAAGAYVAAWCAYPWWRRAEPPEKPSADRVVMGLTRAN
jgi:glycopeptide antibiotics resistance protein